VAASSRPALHRWWVQQFFEIIAVCNELSACVRFHWIRRDDLEIRGEVLR
jgi:hypothetical protein